VARAGDNAFGLDPVKCEIEFYHERRRALARYSIEAATPAAAVALARAALAAEYPAGKPRRWLSLFERAQRIEGQDPSGWLLHRIATR
jgi:hypothetical protein